MHQIDLLGTLEMIFYMSVFPVAFFWVQYKEKKTYEFLMQDFPDKKFRRIGKMTRDKRYILSSFIIISLLSFGALIKLRQVFPDFINISQGVLKTGTTTSVIQKNKTKGRFAKPYMVGVLLKEGKEKREQEIFIDSPLIFKKNSFVEFYSSAHGLTLNTPQVWRGVLASVGLGFAFVFFCIFLVGPILNGVRLLQNSFQVDAQVLAVQTREIRGHLYHHCLLHAVFPKGDMDLYYKVSLSDLSERAEVGDVVQIYIHRKSKKALIEQKFTLKNVTSTFQ